MFQLDLSFAPWQDTIRLHVHLFHCFLLGLLDAHAELVFLSPNSGRLLAFLDRRLANSVVGLTHDAGHVHEPASLGGDATLGRCPPKWRYEATPLPSFALNVPMTPLMGVVPSTSFPARPINVSHGFSEERMPSAAAVWGDAGPFAGVVGCVLLGMLILVCFSWRSPIMLGIRFLRDMCRPLWATKAKISNSDQQSVGSSARERLGTYSRVFVRGPWITGHRLQSASKMLHKFIRDGIQTPWALLSQIGTKTWTCILDLAASVYGSNDTTVLGRDHGDERSSVYQKIGCRSGGSHTDGSRLAMLAGNKRLQPAASRLASESSLSTGTTTAVHNPLRLPSAINDVVAGPISVQGTALNKVCAQTSAWRKIGSVVGTAAKVKLNLDTTLSPGGDDTASESSSAGSGDEGPLGADTQQVAVPPSERKDGYGTIGDGALSQPRSPLLLSRARTAGHLWSEHDRFNDDKETGNDPYWTEQVYARLSGEFQVARCRYVWTDPSWPRAGREDASDNWRTRSSQIDAESAGPNDVQSADSKLRRYSSPCMNVGASPTQRTDSGDGPSEIYVIPQKRGRATSVQCCPTSTPRLFDPPCGLDFLPCRKTPTLLTPTAWRPGCLYVPDPPEDELSQAVAWWDHLSLIGRCETGSTVGHVRDGPVDERAVLFSRDRPPEGPVSWRDRYENDPASRRFVSVHRRAMTSG